MESGRQLPSAFTGTYWAEYPTGDSLLVSTFGFAFLLLLILEPKVGLRNAVVTPGVRKAVVTPGVRKAVLTLVGLAFFGTEVVVKPEVGTALLLQ